MFISCVGTDWNSVLIWKKLNFFFLLLRNLWLWCLSLVLKIYIDISKHFLKITDIWTSMSFFFFLSVHCGVDCTHLLLVRISKIVSNCIDI